MRGGLIIVGIIFWICVSWSPLRELTRGAECEVAQSTRYLNGKYTVAFSGLLNRGNNQKSTFSILKQNPFYYFATEYDTTRLKGFHDKSFESLNHIDFSLIFLDQAIHNSETIRYSLTQSHEPNERYLMEVHEPNLDYIGAAEIIPAQLDFDPEQERIVVVHSGTYATFLFYESYGSYWQYVDAIIVEDAYRTAELDFSLDGFAGIQTDDIGTQHGVSNATYYNFYSGQLRECFTINKESSINMTGFVDAQYIILNAQAMPMMINAQEIFVEHSIEVIKEDIKDSTSGAILNEKLSYSLVQQTDGKFMPDKQLPGFNVRICSEECDSTHFFPEIYAVSQLSNLKTNGTAHQRQLLQDIVFLDSAAVFR